jgi:hypothetical protein
VRLAANLPSRLAPGCHRRRCAKHVGSLRHATLITLRAAEHASLKPVRVLSSLTRNVSFRRTIFSLIFKAPWFRNQHNLAKFQNSKKSSACLDNHVVSSLVGEASCAQLTSGLG